MQENGVATDTVIPEVLVRMRQFTQMNKLKKNALKVCFTSVLCSCCMALLFVCVHERSPKCTWKMAAGANARAETEESLLEKCVAAILLFRASTIANARAETEESLLEKCVAAILLFRASTIASV
eukprot:1147374-Pelagomonas_calceolata.AAC.8